MFSMMLWSIVRWSHWSPQCTCINPSHPTSINITLCPMLPAWHVWTSDFCCCCSNCLELIAQRQAESRVFCGQLRTITEDIFYFPSTSVFSALEVCYEKLRMHYIHVNSLLTLTFVIRLSKFFFICWMSGRTLAYKWLLQQLLKFYLLLQKDGPVKLIVCVFRGISMFNPSWQLGCDTGGLKWHKSLSFCAFAGYKSMHIFSLSGSSYLMSWPVADCTTRFLHMLSGLVGGFVFVDVFNWHQWDSVKLFLNKLT